MLGGITMDENIIMQYESLYANISSSSVSLEDAKNILKSISKSNPYFEQIMDGLNYKLATELKSLEIELGMYDDSSEEYHEIQDLHNELKSKLRASMIHAHEDEIEPVRILFGHSQMNGNPLFITDDVKDMPKEQYSIIATEIIKFIKSGYHFTKPYKKYGIWEYKRGGTGFRMYGDILPNNFVLLLNTIPKSDGEKERDSKIDNRIKQTAPDRDKIITLAYIEQISEIIASGDLSQIQAKFEEKPTLLDKLNEILTEKKIKKFDNLLKEGLSSKEIISTIKEAIQTDETFSDILRDRLEDYKRLCELIGIDYYAEITKQVDDLDNLIQSLKDKIDGLIEVKEEKSTKEQPEKAKDEQQTNDSNNNVESQKEIVVSNLEEQWFKEIPLEIVTKEKWTKTRQNWLFKFNLLVSYYKMYGTVLSMPSTYMALDFKTNEQIIDDKGKYIRLGSWFDYQKERFMEGKMEDWQFNLLSEMEFVEAVERYERKKQEKEEKRQMAEKSIEILDLEEKTEPEIAPEISVDNIEEAKVVNEPKEADEVELISPEKENVKSDNSDSYVTDEDSWLHRLEENAEVYLNATMEEITKTKDIPGSRIYNSNSWLNEQIKLGKEGKLSDKQFTCLVETIREINNIQQPQSRPEQSADVSNDTLATDKNISENSQEETIPTPVKEDDILKSDADGLEDSGQDTGDIIIEHEPELVQEERKKTMEEYYMFRDLITVINSLSPKQNQQVSDYVLRIVNDPDLDFEQSLQELSAEQLDDLSNFINSLGDDPKYY